MRRFWMKVILGCDLMVLLMSAGWLCVTAWYVVSDIRYGDIGRVIAAFMLVLMAGLLLETARVILACWTGHESSRRMIRGVALLVFPAVLIALLVSVLRGEVVSLSVTGGFFLWGIVHSLLLWRPFPSDPAIP